MSSYYNRFDSLSEAARIRRIGELIGLAIRRADHVEEPKAPARSVEVARDEGEKRILEFLGRVKDASPFEIGLEVGLKRLAVFRRLSRLRSLGLLQTTGQRRGVRYALRTEFTSN
jgi:hypothetical protein